MKTNTSVKTSCTLFSPPILPPLLSRAFSIFTSWRLACSPALLLSCSPSWCVGFIHWRGCVLWWQHRSMCVWVLVRGCVSVDMCMCRMKCRLPPIYASHKQTHLHSQRGWLLCKNWRRRGSPEWIRSGLSLLHFTEWVLWHSGVLLLCVSLYVCVDQWGGGSKLKTTLWWVIHIPCSLLERAKLLFCFLYMCFPVWGSRRSFSKELDSILVLNNVQVSHALSLPRHYMMDREWAICKSSMNACSAHI